MDLSLGSDATDPDHRPSPHPAPRAAPASGVFVGREAEMEALLGGLDDVLSGHGRLFLVSGEPGIGKSRLADEAARRAGERGARVLWGRCWEAGGAPAYWPWVQSLRAHLRDADPEATGRHLGSGASDVARMIPEVHEILPGLPEPPSLDPESARFRLFDATASFLRRAAGAKPIALVLDDLHAADTPSLLLLEFLASELADIPALVVATYRDVDPTLDYPLVATLGRLSRQGVTRHLPLRGLGRTDVTRFIRMTTGIAPPEALVEAIHRETEGNPLFVGEVLRLLAAEGRLEAPRESPDWRLSVPQGIRDVIGRRLAGLSEECRRVFTIASVLGREFGLDVLEAMAGRPDRMADFIDEGVAARVLAEVPGSPGRFRFAHALIRDGLYQELPPGRRMALHRRVGEHLERLDSPDPGRHLGEIAHHLFAALPAGNAGKAAECAHRAGERAASLLAYEEAVRFQQMALRALETTGAGDEDLRCRVLLSLGDAQMKVGDGPASRESFLAAARTARSLGLPEHLARAAVGYGGRFVWTRAGGDPHLVPLLEEALEALPERDDVLRVRVLARLAGALRDEPSRERRERHSREAVGMARRVGDASTLVTALLARYTAIWGPDNNEELLAIAEEIRSEAAESREPERVLEGRLLRHNILITTGDIPAAKAELEAAEAVANELRQALQRWYVATYRTTLALFEGRFGEAETAIEETVRLGRRAELMGSEVAHRLQLYVLRREQGRLAELETVIRRSVDEYPWYPLFRCVLAHLHAELGREADARRSLEALAAEGFAGIHVDNEWLFAMSFLPEVCAFLGDEERAGALYDLLLPYEALNAFSQPEVGTGPVSRYLGILASTMARWPDAARHFEETLETTERTGARPWGARARVDYARMLTRRDGPGDRERATALMSEAGEAARTMGMAVLLDQISALAQEPAEGDRRPEHGTPEPAEARRGASMFRRDGEYWSVAFEGESFRLRDTKGLRYLAQLLARPGREIHVLDLLIAAEGHGGADRRPREPGLEASPADDSGDVLDARARAAYRGRLEELQEAIDEAESFGDPERASRARDEMEFLARELAGATGLGGRARKTSSPTERARQSVTKALKAAVQRIAEQGPALGGHLAATIHTGSFCSYTPDPRAPVAWAL